MTFATPNAPFFTAPPVFGRTLLPATLLLGPANAALAEQKRIEQGTDRERARTLVPGPSQQDPMSNAERSSSYRRRSRRLRTAASVVLLAMLAFFASAAARAVDESELDAEINEILTRLPPDQAAVVLDEIFDRRSAGLVTESYPVSPGSLRVRDSSDRHNYFDVNVGHFVTEGGGWGCMYAPLHLPHSASVTGLVMWFVDTGFGRYAADIRRKSITSTAGAEIMGSVESTVGTGIRAVADATISNGLIDNDNYVYFAFVCAGPGAELHGLYITYNR